MEIRHTSPDDLTRLLEIYAHARRYMKRTGNPNQWGDVKPSRAAVEKDIAGGVSYAVCDGDEIYGAFALTQGPEASYAHIENGSWLNDEPYLVIHRVASDGRKHGIISVILDFCEKQGGNIRLDTHDDNLIMQHLLEKHGYTRCGRVYIDDGAPRIGYHKVIH